MSELILYIGIVYTIAMIILLAMSYIPNEEPITFTNLIKVFLRLFAFILGHDSKNLDI